MTSGSELPISMASPTVSVIIPAYNAERFLARTLDSVAHQTYTEFETILIDDGSTDRTASIAQSYDNVRYHYQRNQGPAAARNTGLKMSKGRYLAFLDADDLWHENMLRACVAVLDERPQISAVHTNWHTVDEQGRILRRYAGWQPWRGQIFERLLVTIPLINPAIVWRQQCFEEIGGFDLTPEVNDDWLNWLRIAYRGHLFECLEQPLAFYRMHDHNLTFTQQHRVTEWRRRALDLLFAQIDVEPQLRNRAYAEVHWVSSMAALAGSDIDEAVCEFVKAVALNEQYLWQAETYYAIAHGGKGGRTQVALDNRQAEAYFRRFLAALDESTESGRGGRSRRAWGEAYFHLARMVYDAEEIAPAEARAHLSQAARANPRQFLGRKRALWVLRIVAGRKVVSALRRATRQPSASRKELH